MRWLLRHKATCLFILVYAAVYVGWFLHRSNKPEIGPYSQAYVAFLVVMAAPFGVPLFVHLAIRRFGRRRGLLFVVTPMCVLGAIVYLVASTIYYATRQYPFDPFLQARQPGFERMPREREAGGLRVLLAGGSTTAGFDLPRERRYDRRLEQLLAARFPDRRVEVLNGGMDWYTTRHSLISYTTYGRKWRPDVVVVMHAMNDLVRSFTPPAVSMGPYDDRWRHFYGPAIHAADPPTFAGYLLDRPIDDWYSNLRKQPADVPLERYVALVPFRENLEALVEYAQADGAAVVLVTQPMLIQPAPSEEVARVLMFARAFCVEADSYWSQSHPTPASLHAAMRAFHEAVREVARSKGAVLVDAVAAIEPTLDHFIDDVHHTPAGAHRLAELVAAGIVDAGIVKP